MSVLATSCFFSPSQHLGFPSTLLHISALRNSFSMKIFHFLNPPPHKTPPEAISFLPELLSIVMQCREQARLYQDGFKTVCAAKGPNYISQAFVKPLHLPQYFP